MKPLAYWHGVTASGLGLLFCAVAAFLLPLAGLPLSLAAGEAMAGIRAAVVFGTMLLLIGLVGARLARRAP